MVIRYRLSRSLLRFDEVITIYNKIVNDDDTVEWKRTVVNGVQWSDRFEKLNESGKISIARYVNITLPIGTYEGLILNPANEEDAIVYGEITDEVTEVKGHRIGDLLKKYPKSGRIKTVNDNSNRTYLPNIKVVIG